MVAQVLALSIVIGLVLVGFAIVLLASVRMIHPYEAGILTMFGSFKRRLNPGLNFVPLFSHVIRVDLRTQVAEVGPAAAVSKDNLPPQVGASVRFRVVDPVRAVFKVRDYRASTIAELETTLRTVIAGTIPGEIPVALPTLNARLQLSLAEATEPWGIAIESVEVRPLAPGEMTGSARLAISGAQSLSR